MQDTGSRGSVSVSDSAGPQIRNPHKFCVRNRRQIVEVRLFLSNFSPPFRLGSDIALTPVIKPKIHKTCQLVCHSPFPPCTVCSRSVPLIVRPLFVRPPVQRSSLMASDTSPPSKSPEPTPLPGRRPGASVRLQRVNGRFSRNYRHQSTSSSDIHNAGSDGTFTLSPYHMVCYLNYTAVIVLLSVFTCE